MDELVLTAISLFSGLSRLELAKIIPAFEKVRYKEGELIFEEGAKGDSLFIIANGSVKIFKKDTNNNIKEIAILGPKNCFGEMALFTGEKRSASIIAITEVTAFKLTKERFDKLLRQHHFLALFFNELLSKRLAERNTGEIQEEIEPKKAAIVEEKIKPSFFKIFKIKNLLIIFSGTVVCLGFYLLLINSGFVRSHIIIIELILISTILCGFNLVSFTIVSVSIPLFAVLLEISTPQKAFSGFSSPSWFFLLGVYAIAASLSKSGLLLRLILRTLLKFPTNYYGQTLAIAITGLILTPVLSSNNARIVLISPLTLDMCEALNIKDHTPGSIWISMSMFLGFGQLSFIFMKRAAMNLMMYGLLPLDVSSQISWSFWVKATLILTLVFFVFYYLAIIILYKPDHKIKLNRNIIEAQLITMGPLTRQEKLVVFSVIITILALITEPLHHIDSAWIAMLVFLLFTTTHVLSEKSIRSDIDWNYLLAFGSLIGVGKLITDSELASIIANHLSVFFSALLTQKLSLLLIITLVFYLIRFLLPTNPALLVFMLTFSPIVAAIGINPFVIGLIALLCMNPWFLSNQSVVFQSLYQGTEGRLFNHPETIKLSFIYVFITFIGIILSYPYWQYLGLIKD